MTGKQTVLMVNCHEKLSKTKAGFEKIINQRVVPHQTITCGKGNFYREPIEPQLPLFSRVLVCLIIKWYIVWVLIQGEDFNVRHNTQVKNRMSDLHV